MTNTRRFFFLIMFGVVVLVLSIFVLIRNRSLDDELLAIIGLIGGLAIVLVAIPSNGK